MTTEITTAAPKKPPARSKGTPKQSLETSAADKNNTSRGATSTPKQVSFLTTNEYHTRVKIFAAERGIDMKTVWTKAMDEYIEKYS